MPRGIRRSVPLPVESCTLMSMERVHSDTMPKVVIQSIENGPNLVLIDGKAGIAFCRCGQSSHKPLCDGTHHKVSFQAPAASTTLLE
jgi:CDGSH-type Zn-finger protein